jgi:hypothetical protein
LAEKLAEISSYGFYGGWQSAVVEIWPASSAPLRGSDKIIEKARDEN